MHSSGRDVQHLGPVRSENLPAPLQVMTHRTVGAGVAIRTSTRHAVAADDAWTAVATDGSALGNPGVGGWAWVHSDNSWEGGGAAHATNNQMELMAVLKALQATAGHVKRLEIQSDSRYVIDAMTKWIHGWRKRQWMNSAGQPVANRALIESIDAAMAGRQVKFVWVKAHAGHHANELADTKARWSAGEVQAGREPRPGPGWTD